MSDIKALFDQLKAFKLAPIDTWHPDKTVKIDLRITANGNWIYQGSSIDRHRIVKLFSTVLRLEGDEYFLVTPLLKYLIQVDDAPFMAVELNQQKYTRQQMLYFRTNMDEVVLADETHPLVVVTNEMSGEPSPSLFVRNGLKAKLTRSVYYQLMVLLEPNPSINQPNNALGVYSAGVFFPFGTA